jgi:CheY-like chemotaxis protein/HPt (histidine-containing phosphotransfer) domain-containing protein
MGGEIHVESRLGVGTTMSLVLRLPLADATALVRTVQTIAGAGARSAPSVSAAEREGTLVLLVDDHPTNRAVISRQLQQLGYANEVAHDGEAGWQLWRSDRYALLLTDLHMPRRNGHALAEAVRADERDRGLARKPVIAMSANVSTEEVERSRVAGIDDFLAKPTPLALLAATLQRYLPLPDAATTAWSPVLELDRGVLEDFLHSVQQDVADLRGAMTRGDSAAVAHEAHRIRGASALVGAQALTECAARIEAAARAGEHAMTASALDELDGHLRAFAVAHTATLSG